MFRAKCRFRVFYGLAAILLFYVLSQVFVVSFAFSPETLETGQAPWGVAVDERTNTVYVVNWGSGTVSIINGNTDAIIESVNTAHTPLYATINKNTNSVYITGSQTGKTAIFDVNNPGDVESVDLNLDYAVVNHLTNKMYAIKNIPYPDKSTILVIDGATNQVLSEISKPNEIEALAINEVQNILYAAKWGEAISTNKVASYIYFINGTTDRAFSEARIEGRVLALAFDSINNKLFIRTTLPPQVSVMDANTREILNIIPIERGSTSANGLAINRSTNTVFTISGHLLYAINASDNTLMGATDIGGDEGIAVNSNSGKVYVSNNEWNSITVIDTNLSSNDDFGKIQATQLSYWFEIKISQAIGCVAAGGLAATVLIRRWRRTQLSVDMSEGNNPGTRRNHQNLPHTIVSIFLLLLVVGGLFVTSYIWYGFAAYSGPPPSGAGAIIGAAIYLLVSLWFLVLSIPTVIVSIFLLRGGGKGYYLSLVVLSLWTLNFIWGVSITVPREMSGYWYLLTLPAIAVISAMYPFLIFGKRVRPPHSKQKNAQT